MHLPDKKAFRSAPGMLLAGLGALLLLGLTLPVALGLLGAACMEPLTERVQRQLGISRGAAAAVCILGLLGLLGLGLWMLGGLVLREAAALSRQLPEYLAALGRWGTYLGGELEQLAERLPGAAGAALRSWAGEILSSSGTLAGSLYEKLFSLISRWLAALPGALLFGVTALLAWCFAAGELPRLRELAGTLLPEELSSRLGRWGRSLRSVLGLWWQAQVRILGAQFLLLAAGFLLLRVRLPLLSALLVSLLDALPLFGTGTALLPWGAAALLRGNPGLGLGLLGLYGASALLRRVLEPRFLGAQMGLSPLITLAALYGGWRIGGFWGALLLPILLLSAAHLALGTKGELGGRNEEPGIDMSPAGTD